MNLFKNFFRKLGPGITTGAADDDPSGIATYSQTGAQFGYSQLWLALYMLPLLIAVQEICARIGAVTGSGIATIVKEHYSKKLLYPIALLILIANTINIGADIGSMAEAARLIFPIHFLVLILFFAVFILGMEIFFSYKLYSKILKWLCVSLFAYPITIFLVKQPWATIFKATFLPHIELNFQFLFIVTAVLGTTISPYLFFWETAQVVEEKRGKNLPLKQTLKKNSKFLLNIRFDNTIGMIFSEIGTWSIIVVTATILHKHGITDIKTAADAAKALEPLVHTFPNAGLFARIIFAVGIIGLGLLSVPVLAGSAAYTLGEALGWKTGLNLKLKRAPQFYGVIILATMLGVSLNFFGVNPFKALVYSAVINGIVAVPLLVVIALIAKNKKIMGKHTNGLLSKIFIWIAIVGMGAASITMFFT